MCVSMLSEALLETLRESCVRVDDTICGGSGSMFSKALTALRQSFSFSEIAGWRGHV